MFTSSRLFTAALAVTLVLTPFAAAQDKKKIDPGAAKAKIAKKVGGVEVGDNVAWLAKYKLKTIEGNEFTFGKWFKNKGKDKAKDIHKDDGLLLINFWSCKCPWQKMWDDELSAIAREYQERGLTLVAINSNSKEIKNPESSLKRAKEANIPFKVVLDPGNELADLFGAKTTPHIYLVNSKGKVIYTGAVDNDAKKQLAKEKRKPWLRDAINAHLAGEKVEVKATKPQGCSIKRVKPGNTGA